jgi:surfeit locus 1 family protein
MKLPVFRFKHGVFAPTLFPTLFTLAALPVLLALAFWQVERLEWKKNLIAMIERNMASEPIDATTLIDLWPEKMYNRMRATGIFMHDKEMYRIAPSRDMKAGYHVLTPLKMNNGYIVLVNRGWVPIEKRDPATRKETQTKSRVTVTGIMRIPGGPRWFQPANDPEKNVWYSFDLEMMEQKIGKAAEFKLVPYIIDADKTPPGVIPVGGQTQLDIPNNHLSYAITWFSLSLSLLVIYVIYHWKPARKRR